MLEFAAAAAASEVADDEDIVEVDLFGMEVVARRLTTAQMALLSAARSAGGGEQVNAIFGSIEDMFGKDALVHVKRLIHERRIDMGDLLGGGTDLNPDRGVIDAVIQEFSAGRPTQPSTASSSSRGRGGPKSTGRSPGRGSTRSDSPSTRS
jgi:hypothetical protein